MLCELTSVGPGALTIYRNVSGRFTSRTTTLHTSPMMRRHLHLGAGR